MTGELTVKILEEIRDEIRGTNQRVDALSERVDSGFTNLDLRMSNITEAVLDLASQQRFMVRHFRAVAERDRRIEADFTDLRTRVEVLERKRGRKR